MILFYYLIIFILKMINNFEYLQGFSLSLLGSAIYFICSIGLIKKSHPRLLQIRIKFYYKDDEFFSIEQKRYFLSRVPHEQHDVSKMVN